MTLIWDSVCFISSDGILREVFHDFMYQFTSRNDTYSMKTSFDSWVGVGCWVLLLIALLFLIVGFAGCWDDVNGFFLR